MINIMNLAPMEAERIARANGQTMIADLFAIIADLTDEVEKLTDALDDARDDSLIQWEKNNGSADQYRQFFYDCFEHLDGHYPVPDVSSDYDKAIIFDAITRGEK